MLNPNGAKRPRPKGLRLATLGLALYAVSHIVLVWDRDLAAESSPPVVVVPPRRQLAFLDDEPAEPVPYGRITIDSNYQSLVRPGDVVRNSEAFRNNKRQTTAHRPEIQQGDSVREDVTAAACDDVLLFMPQSFAHNGHGSQLNNYLLAALIATFTDRAMVVLEPPPALNEFKSNSQFGCPPEAWQYKVVRKGGKPKKMGWDIDFPRGLGRLIQHPEWLSRGCPVPCELDYMQWEQMRVANNATKFPVPQETICQTPSAPGEEGGEERQSRSSNVVVMGGHQVRDFFQSHYKLLMLERNGQDPLPSSSSSSSPPPPPYQWALRMGARPHEARVFSALDDRRQIWDYAFALLVRSDIARFQPWIARDVEEYVAGTGLPLDVKYDAIHVRRGDKLEHDARFQVRRYWSELGLYDEETGSMPKDYIPFAHYLRQFEEDGCARGGADEGPRLVYVATDDPVEVRKEIEDLPKDSEGNTLLAVGESGCDVKFRFVFGDLASKAHSFHLDQGVSKKGCEDRYARNIAGVADLMMLSKASVFVGEFNSNWGRLVRTFRLRVNDSAKVAHGARPVLVRGQMKVAWGRQDPGSLGW